jgi:hypothetical protein
MPSLVPVPSIPVPWTDTGFGYPADMNANLTQAPISDRQVILRVTNPGHSAVHIRIEPWAREYDLFAGTSREFVFTGSDPADIEVEVLATAITIYGWTGSVLDGIGLPVPPTPRGSGDVPAL